MESFCFIRKWGMIVITKPDISPDFTIEDIHKIREYHYELTKNMTLQEKMDFYNDSGKAFLNEMDKRKRGTAHVWENKADIGFDRRDLISRDVWGNISVRFIGQALGKWLFESFDSFDHRGPGAAVYLHIHL